jgi:two-component system phosphate regulon sensor histidine kinase PhoR
VVFPRAFRRFFFGYLLLHILAVILLVWVLTAILRTQMKNAAKEKMGAIAEVLREHVEEQTDGMKDGSIPAHLDAIGLETGYRFTLVDRNGVVVYDSETKTRDIGDHIDRPEIVQALKSDQGDRGFAERYSNTLKTSMLYCAVALRGKDGFIRIAIPADQINSAIGALQKYTWLFALATGLLTGFLMMLFSSKALQPLSLFSESARKIGDGKYDERPKLIGRDDEWGELAEAFHQMQNELQNRELRLTENNERLEAVLSSMIEGVFSLDANGVVQIANRAACEILDRDFREFVGKPLLEVARVPELNQAINAAKENRSNSKTEFETTTTPRRLISARVSAMGDQEHPPLAIILHDVTELRQLETMRKDFVANVSHELKTPLSSIKAYAETLRMGAINDQEKNLEFVGQIEKSADLLSDQVRELLALARIESRQTHLESERININQVCQEAIDSLAEIARKSNIELGFEEASDIFVRADHVGLQTIINNLLTNAINYTPSGGSVTVDVFANSHWAVIQVRDTGIGIVESEQTRVFERFYRVDKARSRDVGGTGLGLAIVKHLTLAMGGRVNLVSKVGKGSVFEVHLPQDL